MTQTAKYGFILVVIFSLFSQFAFAAVHTIQTSIENGFIDSHSKQPVDNSGTSKMPVFPAPHNKAPHGKMHTPQMDELAHMHKFHKERVKKSKNKEKYWLLSKILLVLCHLSILVIAYLHATH